jgi:DNA-3-methyladenine glycosylase II
METFTIVPRGPFRLLESAMFEFGQRADTSFDGTMRLAFCVDGYRHQAAVAVTQDGDGTVHVAVTGATDGVDTGAVARQVARVLSLDHDADGYAGLADRDPVIGRLMDAAPGLRPPLFYSPYEAALWAVISIRRPRPTAERWRRRLSQSAGARFVVAGEEMWAVPTPEQVLALGPSGVAAATGMESLRAERVVGVARAAAAGTLDAAALAALEEDEARRRLRTIPGIGPFYGDLILIRATGLTDVLPLDEPQLWRHVTDLYRLEAVPTRSQAAGLAEGWRPWRTWVGVLIRTAAGRLERSAGHAGVADRAAV